MLSGDSTGHWDVRRAAHAKGVKEHHDDSQFSHVDQHITATVTSKLLNGRSLQKNAATAARATRLRERGASENSL